MPISGGTRAFAGALKKALAPETGTAAEPEGETPIAEQAAVRQKLAGDGKALPESPDGETADGDDSDKSSDIAFAWFGASLVLPQPATAPALPKFPAGARAIQLPGAPLPAAQLPTGSATPLPGIAPLPADPAPVPAAAAPVAAPAEAPAQEIAPAELKLSAALATSAPGTEAKPPVAPAAPAKAEGAPDKPAAPIRIEIAAAPEAPKQVQPITLASIQPRAEAVHAAAGSITAAVETPTQRRQTLRETTISSITTLAADAPRTHAVPAMAEAQQQSLDLQTRDGMQAMVDRITALRDTPNARETSIRLSPDALGTVNISIRHEGDRVHVHFTADNAAARTALADAQPRLAELAEARGLRLGQTSVDGGAAGQGQHLNQGQRQSAAPQPVSNPAPASMPGGDLTTDADARVA